MNLLTNLDVSIDFPRGKLRIGETTHFLQRKLPVRSFAIQVERTVVMPPLSEAVVHTRPRRRQHVAPGHNCCLHPVNSFAEKTGLALGGTLVMSSWRTMPVLVVNPIDEPVIVPAGLVTAICMLYLMHYLIMLLPNGKHDILNCLLHCAGLHIKRLNQWTISHSHMGLK